MMALYDDNSNQIFLNRKEPASECNLVTSVITASASVKSLSLRLATSPGLSRITKNGYSCPERLLTGVTIDAPGEIVNYSAMRHYCSKKKRVVNMSSRAMVSH